jgi:type II secretory pathway pseudopilin PulG
MTHIVEERWMKNRRGSTLVDVTVALVLLAMGGLVFSATFPSGFSAVRQAGEMKRGLAIAQQKLEQVKALGYESLNYSNLRADNAIDTTNTSSPYEFTSVDNLSSSLAGAKGELYIDENSSNPGVRKVTVKITWTSGKANHDITLWTLIADKRPWKG